MLRHGEMRRRLRAFARDPVAKRFPRNVCPFTVTQSDHIDEYALRRINADRKLVADGKLFSAEIERLASEEVNIDRLTQNRNAAAAREGDVDTRWNDVRQPVAG
jgi:hypothetical protein